MLNLENLKKQAKLLVRWHREGNHSVGGRIRNLPRYRRLTDKQALALKFPLAEAQEILAVEAGYASWAALKAGVAAAGATRKRRPAPPVLKRALPMIYVSDVCQTADFFREKLGFAIDFLHGEPPFYGSVSRGGATLHLRFVHEPVFVADIRQRESLLAAFIEIENIKPLFAEYKAAGVGFVHALRKEPWGGSAFTVRDPDGNWICFAE